MHATTLTRPLRPAVLAALALVVALLAGVLHPVTAEARSSVPARTRTEVSYANAVDRLLNAERATKGLKPVRTRAALLRSARAHNLAMARANTMAHQLRGERSLGSRITAAGYKWTWAGENIGWNSAMTSAGVLMLEKVMFAERPPYDGHRRNILNPHFTNVGIDVYLDKVHHKVWLTVDFGRP